MGNDNYLKPTMHWGIGGHKSVNRLSVNNQANFFINSLIRKKVFFTLKD